MQSVDMGGRSLLDESVVFFGSHLQNLATHAKTDMGRTRARYPQEGAVSKLESFGLPVADDE